MNPLRLAQVAAIAAPLAFFFGACSSSRNRGNSAGTSDDGGAGGQGGAPSKLSSSASSMGQGGDEGIEASEPPAACFGNKELWEQLTSSPIPCEKNSDCCVIMGECLSDAQIVAAAPLEEALLAWPFCLEQCNDCLPSAIDVACLEGICRGRVVLEEANYSDLRRTHCGDDNKILPFLEGTTDVHFGCDD